MATPLSELYNRQNQKYDINDQEARNTLATKITRADIIATLYPVGSIYISTASTNPSTFLGGTWSRVSGEVFLMAAGSTYSAGTTGGAVSHTLDVANLPSHNHTFSGTASNTKAPNRAHTHTGNTSTATGNHTHAGSTGTQNQAHKHTGNSHTHSINSNAAVRTTGLVSGVVTITSSASPSGSSSSTTPGNVDASGTAHTHSITINVSTGNHTHTVTTGDITKDHTHSATAKGTVGSQGSGAAFDIIPPYLAVYMWTRTA